MIITAVMMLLSCNSNQEIQNNDPIVQIDYEPLPTRSGKRPRTTPNIPHHQIGVDIVPEVHDEMVRRIYSIPGIEDKPSVVLSWQGMWIKRGVDLVHPEAILGGREFSHIHDDGSLHIFLEPSRAAEAVKAGWAIEHPFAIQSPSRWKGFVMLYTPQSMEELDVTFQLIVEGYNYVTGQSEVATNFY